MGRDIELQLLIIRYIGHVLRKKKYGLLQLILKGKIEGKRNPERQQILYIGIVCDWTGMPTIIFVKTAKNK